MPRGEGESETVEQLTRDRFRSLIWQLEDELCETGVSAIELIPGDDSETVYIETLVVAPEHQGEGVASRLLGRLCRHADSQRLRLSLVPIAHDNEQWIRFARFYARFGFAFSESGSGLMRRKPGAAACDPRLDLVAEPTIVPPDYWQPHYQALRHERDRSTAGVS